MAASAFYAYWGNHNINPHPHLHDKFEIYISLNNKADFFLQETRYPLEIGRVFLIRPFAIHHGFSAKGEETCRYCVQFSRETLQKFSTESTNLVQLFENAPATFLLNHRELAELCALTEDLLQPEEKAFGSDLAQSIVFARFLLFFSRLLHKAGPARKKTPTEDDRTVSQVLQYIYKQYRSEISLDDLADALHFSKSRLCKIFKDRTGFTIGGYLTMYRLQTACSLLEKGGRVKDVGEAVGFQTYTHFIRTFTGKLGISPKKFMLEHRQPAPDAKNSGES